MTFQKGNKYGAKVVTVDGIKFHSIGEAKRWQELLLLEKQGKISHLERQVSYDLRVNGHLICRYVADFTYLEEGGVWYPIVEDFKGVLTDTYKLKKKMMWAIHGIEIRETGRAARRRRKKRLD
jgi:hypothetical protein